MQNLSWYHRSRLTQWAGAPYYDLAKEREGAPFSFPRRSCPNLFKLPSFSLSALTKERVVLALANIQVHYQLLTGASNPLLELTKLMDSVTLGRVHGNLLLAQQGYGFGMPLSYQEVTAFSTR